MSGAARLLKAAGLLASPRWIRAAAMHRVAAAVEHLDAIRLCDAATLIDIGANKGQFSLAYRALFPKGKIIAFEPFEESAQRFRQVFEGDAQVTLHGCALADVEDEATFHVTTRRDSSSLLKPGVGQSDAFHVHGEMQIKVPVKRLDQVIDMRALQPGPILIKIDVQGAELKVLQGCDDLSFADFVYVELSFVSLYDGQPLFDEVASYLFTRGFEIAGVFNQTLTAKFGPTQVDVLFKSKSGGCAT